MKLFVVLSLVVVGTLAYLPGGLQIANKNSDMENNSVSDLVKENFKNLSADWLGCLTTLITALVKCGSDGACIFKALTDLITCLTKKGLVVPERLMAHEMENKNWGLENTAVSDFMKENFKNLSAHWLECLTSMVKDLIKCGTDGACIVKALTDAIACFTKKGLVAPGVM